MIWANSLDADIGGYVKSECLGKEYNLLRKRDVGDIGYKKVKDLDGIRLPEAYFEETTEIKLKFIGNGSAFNTKLGNNSAFIYDKQGSNLILIDCGGSIFGSIMDLGLLNGVKKASVLITHLHPDHIGSLGDLIFYNYYVKGIKTQIYHEGNNIIDMLDLMDVNREMYNYIDLSNIENINFRIGTYEIEPVKQSHRGLTDAYGYLFKNSTGRMYYSGDSEALPSEVLDLLESGELDKLYQDASSIDYDGNPHLSIGKLAEMIKEKDREKVWLMHLDEKFEEEKALELGFMVTKNIYN